MSLFGEKTLNLILVLYSKKLEKLNSRSKSEKATTNSSDKVNVNGVKSTFNDVHIL